MATGFADSAEVISAIDALAKEKKINKEVLYSKIESALVSAYKRSFGKTDNVRAVIDRTTGQIEVLAHKNIVENVVDPAAEISLTDVRANYPALSMYMASATWSRCPPCPASSAASPRRPPSRSSCSTSAKPSAA